MRLDIALPEKLRKALRFGSAIGIEIRGEDLEVVAVRVRPGSIRVLGHLSLKNCIQRPAGEWGAEYSGFAKSVGVAGLSATVLLPRREVIVRQVSLPGVAGRDIEGALRLQLETLHPYDEDEVAWGWSHAGANSVLVGITPAATVEQYVKLFTEAGVPVSSFTFSAAALYAAIRLNGASAGSGFVALGAVPSGGVEAYGESPARPVFSAYLDIPAARAVALAISELRLPPETEPVLLEQALPHPDSNPVENDLSRNALPYATALAGACPRLSPAANLLPTQHRSTASRMMLAPTLILAGVFFAVAGGGALWLNTTHRNYMKTLRTETAKLMPVQERSAALDRATDRLRARAIFLDKYRDRTRKDLDLLKDLTKLVEPPAWSRAVDITRDSARLQGEAPQAAALWKIIDSSRLFSSSSLEYNQPSAAGESFSIRATREASK
jgi:hypothetical protein